MSAVTGYGPTQYLFDRDWSVLLIPVNYSGKDVYNNPLPQFIPSQGQLYAKSQVNGNGDVLNGSYTNLRVVFDVLKTSEGLSNKGKIEIWNLNPTTRKSVQKGCQIQLSAGYSGLMKRIVFADVLAQSIKVERRKQDIITSFEFGESERQLETAIFFKNYPSGTFFSQIVKDCAKVMNVAQSTIIGIDDFAYNRPFVFCGTVKQTLDYLTIDNNIQHFVQNDELFVLPVGQSISNQAIVLASGLDELGLTTDNTGLIGIPNFAIDSKAVYSCLLNPDVFPGQLVQIISENVNGFFVVRTAHYKGDSHGHEWQIDCESTSSDRVNAVQISQNQVTNNAFGIGANAGITAGT